MHVGTIVVYYLPLSLSVILILADVLHAVLAGVLLD